MTDTRGPAPGKVPPHVQDRLADKRRAAQVRAERGPAWLRPPALATYGVLLLLVGAAVGFALRGDAEQRAAAQIAAEVLPLSNEAEALFRVGMDGGPGIAESAQALEVEDEPSAIEQHLDAWVAEHQRILDALSAVEVGPLAAPLRDLFEGAVRAQLDAVVLFGAAAAHDGSARQELLRAAIREVGRSRALLSDARTALAALGGPQTPAVEVPSVPGLTRPGQPLPSPFAPPTADEGTDATDAGAGTADEPAADPTPTPSPS